MNDLTNVTTGEVRLSYVIFFLSLMRPRREPKKSTAVPSWFQRRIQTLWRVFRQPLKQQSRKESQINGMEYALQLYRHRSMMGTA